MEVTLVSDRFVRDDCEHKRACEARFSCLTAWPAFKYVREAERWTLSRAYPKMWAVGLKLELSPFWDMTIYCSLEPFDWRVRVYKLKICHLVKGSRNSNKKITNFKKLFLLQTWKYMLQDIFLKCSPNIFDCQKKCVLQLFIYLLKKFVWHHTSLDFVHTRKTYFWHYS